MAGSTEREDTVRVSRIYMPRSDYGVHTSPAESPGGREGWSEGCWCSNPNPRPKLPSLDPKLESNLPRTLNLSLTFTLPRIDYGVHASHAESPSGRRRLE